MYIKRCVISVFVFQLLLVGTPFQAAESNDNNRIVYLFLETSQQVRDATVGDNSPGDYADFLAKHQLSEEDVQFLHAAKRFRPVTINEHAIQPHALMKGDMLYLDVFHDVTVKATIDAVEQDMNGVYSIIAQVENSALGYVLLSIANRQILGAISLPEYGQEFQLSAMRNMSEHIIQEVDPARKDELMSGPSLIPPYDKDSRMSSSEQRETPRNVRSDTVIDVMIVYTPAAKNWAATNATSIAHVINQVMSRAQNSLNNSNVGITMRLAHSAEVTYTESGSSGTDLERLTSTNDGYMDVVHTWRNTYGADVVSLLTKIEDTGGRGWLLSDRNGSPSYAFNLNRVQQSHNSYTVIHEIGHNMGLHHHKEQNVQPGPTSWWNWSENTWSAGWRWVGTDGGRYCSVMTYESGQYFSDGQTHVRVPYFSNPNISYAGIATGHATHGDNARTLRETKGVIANYRTVATSGNSYLLWTGAASSASIAGTWSLSYDWGCDGTPGSASWYINSNGTFIDSQSNSGTWTLQGSQVTLTYPGPVTYTGTVAGNTMQGTMVSFGGGTGCWSASRASQTSAPDTTVTTENTEVRDASGQCRKDVAPQECE